MNITDLPKPIFGGICQYLSIGDLGRLGKVSKFFNTELKTNPLIISNCWQRTTDFLGLTVAEGEESYVDLSKRITEVKGYLANLLSLVEDVSEEEPLSSASTESQKSALVKSLSKLTLDVKKNPLFLDQIPSTIKKAELHYCTLRSQRPVPEDIQSLLNKETPLTLKELKFLKDFYKAGDTLIVWDKLATIIKMPLNVSLDTLLGSSSESVLNKAEKFSSWCADPIIATRLATIQSLGLSNLGISYLPPEIGHLAALTHLCLAGNNLAILPDEIDNFTHLEHIDLNHNAFSNFPCKLTSLQKLKTLCLNYNNLSELPPEIETLTNLVRFLLGNNKLKAIPPQIGKLTRLEHLDLEKNELTFLPSEIGDLIFLFDLNIKNNNLSNLPPEIKKLSPLFSLFLEGNNLKDLPPDFKWPQAMNADGPLQAITAKNRPLYHVPHHVVDKFCRGIAIGVPLIVALYYAPDSFWSLISSVETTASQYLSSFFE